MSKNNENKLVPKLRFPNYSESWTVLPVSEICEVFKGSPLSKIDLEENGTEPCIHYGELFTKYNEVILVTYSKTNRKNGFRSVVGDILMPSSDVTPTGLVKASAIMLDNVILGGDMNILRPQTDINSIFFSYLLNRSKREIIKLVSGTTVKHIYPSQIITCRLPIIKNFDEQQKIAACLSSLDELIEAESQKLELYQQHKKGLLQNLFPQEGETVPKLRFKEFEDSGDWEAKRLGEIATFVNEKTQLENLSINSYISTENLLPDYAGVILASKLPSSGNFTKYQKGDVLVSNIRPYLKKVWFAEKDGGCSNDVIVIRSNSFILDVFLSLLLRNDAFISYIMKSAEGVKMPRGDKDSIKDYPITFPREKTEQQKIASCLSSLDDLINAQRQKIELLKQHKKGLLQGLFPPINN
jgi:type I restriction enzyme S subunit